MRIGNTRYQKGTKVPAGRYLKYKYKFAKVYVNIRQTSETTIIICLDKPSKQLNLLSRILDNCLL